MLAGGFTFFEFSPLGKWSNLTNIFQLGWNHQLVWFWVSLLIAGKGGAFKFRYGSSHFISCNIAMETPRFLIGNTDLQMQGIQGYIWMFPKIGVFTPKMDGENNGSKPYVFKWMIWGGFPTPIFGLTPIYFGLSPLPVTVTTRIITFLVGDPYKPSFATVTVRGDNPTYTMIQCWFTGYKWIVELGDPWSSTWFFDFTSESHRVRPGLESLDENSDNNNRLGLR